MLKEIYCKTINDPTYQPEILEHSDVYEAVLSKIRMILFTERGEVLGEPGFGVNLEQYVFTTRVSGEDIKKMILKQITTYIPEAQHFKVSVDINFKQGATSDVCFVDIKLNGTNALGIILN